MRIHRIVLLSIFFIASLCLLQAQVLPAPPSQMEATGFAVEIICPGKAPLYFPVPGEIGIHPDPIPPWTLFTAWGISLRAQPEQRGVLVHIVAATGELSQFRQEPIALYLLQENQSTVVPAAARVGRTPFQIRIVKVRPFALDPPVVINLTQSIELVSVTPMKTTFPSYKTTLRNLSAKNVVAVRMPILKGSSTYMIWMKGWDKGRPLMRPGETCEIVTSNWLQGYLDEPNGRMTEEGLEPVNLSRMVIATAIFDDGAYEGSSAGVADFKAGAASALIQIRRILAVLDESSYMTEYCTAYDLDTLSARITSLDENVEPFLIRDMLDRYPISPVVPRRIEDVMRDIIRSNLYHRKKDALEQIGRIKGRASSSDPEALAQTFRKFKEGIERWGEALARVLRDE